MLKNLTIAVVIPALNEEKLLGEVIEAIPGFVDHIIVVDDGSTDRTVEVAEQKGAISISHNTNKGVGAALSTGVDAVLSMDVDIMVNIDADGQFNPADIEKLVQPILDGHADFVTASRFIDKAYKPKMPVVKYWGNRFMSNFISRLTRQKFYDVSCGFRAYSREALQRLNLFGEFTYTQETFIDLAFKKIAILEVPVHVKGTREHGKSRVASNLFRYGVQTLKIIIQTFRDNKPFRLFGFMSVFVFLLGLGFAIFLGLHYLKNGVFTPHKWAGFIAGFLFVVSLLLLLIGFVLDMFARMRRNQEEILFQLKRDRDNG
ncbi:MAG: glycosyltransferase family 2 protein [Bacteroidales bacterium]|nr:glycosyltransferase family 2 protein [Bacteroidales bacterium]